MEEQLIAALMDAGPVGVIALLVFWFYRQDRKHSENRYSQLVERQQEIQERDIESREEMAKVLGSLQSSVNQCSLVQRIRLVSGSEAVVED